MKFCKYPKTEAYNDSVMPLSSIKHTGMVQMKGMRLGARLTEKPMWIHPI